MPAEVQSTHRIHGCAFSLNTVDPCLDLCAVKDRQSLSESDSTEKRTGADLAHILYISLPWVSNELNKGGFIFMPVFGKLAYYVFHSETGMS